MPLKTEQLEEPGLNLTPMIDMVFLLIIFFMVGSHFSEQERQFDVKLPTVSVATPLTAPPDELVINVYEDGRLQLAEKPRTREELLSDLQQAVQRYEDQAVVIRGEGEGRYQGVIDVMATCHQAGIKHISVATVLQGE